MQGAGYAAAATPSAAGVTVRGAVVVRGQEGASGKVPVAAHTKRNSEYCRAASTNAGARSVRRRRDGFSFRPLLYLEVARVCAAAVLATERHLGERGGRKS